MIKRGWNMGNRWWKQRTGRGRFYQKSLILVLCITSLPTAVIGIASYVLGVTNIERAVASAHQVLLGRTTARMDETLSQLELAASQWALDPRMDASLKETDLKREYNTSYALFSFLGLIKATYPFIGEVQLYLKQDLPVVLSDSGGIRQIAGKEEQDQLNRLLDNTRGIYWLTHFSQTAAGPQEKVVLVNRLPVYGKSYGALLFIMDRAKLTAMVQETALEKEGPSLLIDDAGELIVQETSAAEGSEPFRAALMTDVRKRQGENKERGANSKAAKSGSYLFKWDHESYSVSYSKLARSGTSWTYVTASPLSAMTGPIILLSRSLFAVSLTGLLLAVLLSWLGSRRLYRPIHRLVALVREPRRDAASMEQDIGYGDSANHPGSRKQDRSTGYDGDEMGYIESRWRDMSDEKQAIQAELKRAYPSLRAGFLMQLVNGHYHMLSEEELMERMAGFGWPLNAGDRIAVLLLQIGRLSSPERRFRENEEQLMTFAAANVAQEFVQGKIQQAEVINFQDTTVAILIPCPAWETPQQTKEQLLTLARELAQMLRSLLKLQAVICYGGPDRVQEVPVLLSYLRGAIRHRDLKEDWQVMELADMLPAGGEAGSYPFSLEKELIQSVRLGHAEESAGRMEAFFRELTHRCVTEKAVQEGALQLLGSLLHTMMEAGFQPPGQQEGGNLYEQLLSIREPEAMLQLLQNKVLGAYMKWIFLQQDRELKQIVDRVKEELERSFAGDISLESCAESCGLSTFSLSRAFKQIHGINFIEYLAAVRIAKGKELLRTTDLRVNEIAEAVGYQPSYFIRVFRKAEGLTPGQYRDQRSG